MAELPVSPVKTTLRHSLVYPRKPAIAQSEARAAAQRRFLEKYTEFGTITHAAEAVGIDTDSHYDWLANDPAYAEQWARAQYRYVERLERAADRRAVEGVDRDVWHKGEKVGTSKVYSDNLLMFLLRGRNPEVYGVQRTELSGPGGGPVEIAASRLDALSRLSPAALEALRELARLSARQDPIALPSASGEADEGASAVSESPEAAAKASSSVLEGTFAPAHADPEIRENARDSLKCPPSGTRDNQGDLSPRDEDR